MGSNLDAARLIDADAVAELDAARQIWVSNGADKNTLHNIKVQIDDLPGNSLAMVNGNTIILSADAAQWGWYTNAETYADPNFVAPYANATSARAVQGSAADGRIDLLTTMLAQIGGILGLISDGSDDSLMNAELPAGVRRMIGAGDITGQGQPDQGEGMPPLSESALRDLFNNTRAQDAPVYSKLVAAAPPAPSTDSLVTTANAIDIFQPGNNFQPVLVGQVTQDNKGQPLQLYGEYVRQIAFSDDGTLAFIAGRENRIYVFDTMTQDIVATYRVDGAASPISSLLVNDGWLYVAEGRSYGDAGVRLLRVNIDSGPDFLKKQQTLSIPGTTAPFGVRDIAINSGRYLAVTVPAGRIPLGNFPFITRRCVRH